mmetsp:Transcript_66469/g.191048  ORF Transcript_66469/g.191048 Transcript_66469/m.191048 type:complete len:231 (+) Transcript_66469:185-877(+)
MLAPAVARGLAFFSTRPASFHCCHPLYPQLLLLFLDHCFGFLQAQTTWPPSPSPPAPCSWLPLLQRAGCLRQEVRQTWSKIALLPRCPWPLPHLLSFFRSSAAGCVQYTALSSHGLQTKLVVMASWPLRSNQRMQDWHAGVSPCCRTSARHRASVERCPRSPRRSSMRSLSACHICGALGICLNVRRASRLPPCSSILVIFGRSAAMRRTSTSSESGWKRRREYHVWRGL